MLDVRLVPVGVLVLLVSDSQVLDKTPHITKLQMKLTVTISSSGGDEGSESKNLELHFE